jgi:hypothetical protein
VEFETIGWESSQGSFKKEQCCVSCQELSRNDWNQRDVSPRTSLYLNICGEPFTWLLHTPVVSSALFVFTLIYRLQSRNQPRSACPCGHCAQAVLLSRLCMHERRPTPLVHVALQSHRNPPSVAKKSL